VAKSDVMLGEFVDACRLAIQHATAGDTSTSSKATIKYDDRQGNKVDYSYKSKAEPPPDG